MPGLPVRYTITGVNPGSGAVTTGADGTAVISWLGAKVGTDTLTAFVDRDGNGTWDVNTEPRQIVTVTFAPLPPPVPGKSVASGGLGHGLIKRPGSAARARRRRRRASCRSRARRTSRSARSWTRARAASR